MGATLGLEEGAHFSSHSSGSLKRGLSFLWAVKLSIAGIPSSVLGGLGLRPIYSPAVFPSLGLAAVLGPSSLSQARLAGLATGGRGTAHLSRDPTLALCTGWEKLSSWSS